MLEHTITTPVGRLTMVTQDKVLLSLRYSNQEITKSNDPFQLNITKNLNEYFTNPHHTFDISFKIKGTPFQENVWSALQKIPAGKVLTYGVLAKQLKTSPRAIGNACRANPVTIIIPCHRIVGVKGIGGYAGKTSGNLHEAKGWLLRHEGVV